MSPKKLAEHLQGRSDGANLAEQLNSEKQSLLSWGKDQDVLYTEASFSQRKIAEEQYLGGGNEHDVYFDDSLNRVVKIVKTPAPSDTGAHYVNYGAQGSLKSYLLNLHYHNIYFGDDIRIEGVLLVQQFVTLITSQPFVAGRKASEKEIEGWFLEQGYQVGNQPHTFHLLDTAQENITVFDARPDNIIRTQSGELIPIDLQLKVYPSES